MYKAYLRNSQGDTVRLTNNERRWQVVDIQGLSSAIAQVNMSNIVGLDGSRFNSSFLTARNIVIYIRINGNVEENRLYLESFAPTKTKVRFFYQNEHRDVYIDGIVDKCDYELFTKSQIMQISLICGNPLFFGRQKNSVEISNMIALFEFPFSINSDEPIPLSDFESGRTTEIINNTQIDTWVEIDVTVLGSFTSIIIQNVETGEFMKFDYSFVANDQIYINTNPSDVTLRLTRDGKRTNLFRYMDLGSTIIQLHSGINVFGYSINNHSYDDRAEIAISYRDHYRGV